LSDLFTPLERALLAYTDSLRLHYDDRDDPVVEIAAPSYYRPQNLGREIGYEQPT
jgi:hypothetical protein